MTTFDRQTLVDLVGPDDVLTDVADIAPYLTDHRHLYRGRALAVLLPRTVEQIANILRFCNENRIGVVPHGGNTATVAARPPTSPETR